jgi:glycosyltransferase involved in cell wall biosynthesis
MSCNIPRNPLVSIIIPCYNSDQFVGEAIESALAQSYPSLEILVVDDGSTDRSKEMISRYPVRLILNDHRGGVSAARNRGIKESRGEFLLFLDSDDRLLPNAVASGLATLQQYPDCAMVVSAHNLIKVDGQLIRTKAKTSRTEDAYRRLLRSNFVECTSSALFRRSMFPVESGFIQGVEGSEDYELYLRVARNHKVRCAKAVVAEYRLHSSNLSRNSEKMLVHTLKVLELQKPYLKQKLAYAFAYALGWWSWRRKYGRQLTMELACNGSVSWRTRRRVSAILAANYPPGAVIVLLAGLLPRGLAALLAYGLRSLSVVSKLPVMLAY